MSDTSNLSTYSVWVRGDGQETTYVTSVRAPDWETAGKLGLLDCAEAWEMPVSELHLLGVAPGEVNLLFWDDEVLKDTSVWGE